MYETTHFILIMRHTNHQSTLPFSFYLHKNQLYISKGGGCGHQPFVLILYKY
ncbi:hypothetical protein HanIR_Chr09g0407701 [Helianthus annuus]|nr:hypothetical protein HanIR_Chr09g0407701 [Helianthus annuus]